MVGGLRYALSHLHKDRLQAIVSIPIGQDCDLGWIDLAVHLTHERQVYAGQELDSGWPLRVGLPASDLEGVDAVLVYSLPMIHESCERQATGMSTHVSRANDRPVPIGHEHVVAVLEAVRARAIADALLALLELLEQTEVARD
jgi:hypothetical protein